MDGRQVISEFSRRKNGEIEERRIETRESFCDHCGGHAIEESRTDRWVKMRDGRWLHASYSMPVIHCSYGCFQDNQEVS